MKSFAIEHAMMRATIFRAADSVSPDASNAHEDDHILPIISTFRAESAIENPPATAISRTKKASLIVKATIQAMMRITVATTIFALKGFKTAFGSLDCRGISVKG
jgi:hypothetical protein